MQQGVILDGYGRRPQDVAGDNWSVAPGQPLFVTLEGQQIFNEFDLSRLWMPDLDVMQGNQPGTDGAEPVAYSFERNKQVTSTLITSGTMQIAGGSIAVPRGTKIKYAAFFCNTGTSAANLTHSWAFLAEPDYNPIVPADGGTVLAVSQDRIGAGDPWNNLTGRVFTFNPVYVAPRTMRLYCGLVVQVVAGAPNLVTVSVGVGGFGRQYPAMGGLGVGAGLTNPASLPVGTKLPIWGGAATIVYPWVGLYGSFPPTIIPPAT